MADRGDKTDKDKRQRNRNRQKLEAIRHHRDDFLVELRTLQREVDACEAARDTAQAALDASKLTETQSTQRLRELQAHNARLSDALGRLKGAAKQRGWLSPAAAASVL